MRLRVVSASAVMRSKIGGVGEDASVYPDIMMQNIRDPVNSVRE